MFSDSEDSLKTPPGSEEEVSSDEESKPVNLEPSADLIARKGKETREWDMGKMVMGKFVEPADVDDNPFKRRNPLGGKMEVDQEAWVDRQRKKRNEDFAPPTAYESKPGGKKTQRDKYDKSHLTEEDNLQRLYNAIGSYKEGSKSINNECDTSKQPKKSSSTKSYTDLPDLPGPSSSRKRTEVPPPSNFDYYNSIKEKAMEDAIRKGLRRIKESM